MTPSEEPELPLLEPLEGIPDVIDTPRALTRALTGLQAGTGPVGIDAERASGFRYGQRAYLVQVYRVGGGTWLIDPIALPDLSRLASALEPLEWILHAASQDLPCLAEIGLRPQRLFDTELAGRLLGRERVGLAPLVASELGWHLEKGHGAADWSTRPLPETWRRYAALDVEVLPALREHLAADLRTSGKAEWAAQEFTALAQGAPPVERSDPWRRTSGIHAVRSRRGLAIVRSLWQARDVTARERDIAPGRLLPDFAIVAVAASPPDSQDQLTSIRGFAKGRAAGLSRTWWQAISEAQSLADSQLPEAAVRGDGPPPPRLWATRDPAAGARLSASRAGLAKISEKWNIPVENLATPDAVRRVLWTPPEPVTEAAVADRLADLGARQWQLDLVVPVLVEAMIAGGAAPVIEDGTA